MDAAAPLCNHGRGSQNNFVSPAPHQARPKAAIGAGLGIDAGERDRLNASLLRLSTQLVNSSDGHAVLQRLCDALVAASPHIRLAWIWMGSADVRHIEPQVMAGPAREYAQTLRIPRSWLTRMGPVYQALKGREVVSMRVSRFSLFAPWRRAAARYGFGEAIAMRLDAIGENQSGVVVFYADHPDYFEAVGLEPFESFISLARSMLHQCRIMQELDTKATTDSLTGLLNRRGMGPELDQAFESSQRDAEPFALILLDLDRFKLLNDSFGHVCGDAALVHVAQILRKSVRPGDSVARWGGEEFLVLLRNTDLPQATVTAERLRQDIATTPATFAGNTVHLSASLGVATPASLDCNAERLLARVDALLYDAKRAGRNTVRTPEHGESRILSVGAQLQEALEARRIRVAYQRLVDLRDESIVGYEALARLQTADGRIVAAGVFIDAAHRLRLEHRVDAQVIEQALRHCAAGQQAGLAGPKHLINCSADFLGRPDCLESLIHQAQALCPDCAAQTSEVKPVIIEITERQFLRNPSDTLRKLQPLLDFGFELAVDDFGSGYSSFLYLLDLPVRYLKIEMALVQRAVTDPRAKLMIRSIHAMARDLGLRTIAEGVETPAMRDILREIGIDWGQGYLWGRPALEDEALACWRRFKSDQVKFGR
jgi:diguanylate cyclase (GGDEF)-like protein